MILVLEGPDKCGKTTLFEALKHNIVANFIPGMGMSKGLLPFMAEVDRRMILMWEAMYDPSKLYICDRSPFVSGPVYDQLYDRVTAPFNMRWYDELRVVYLDLPIDELSCRYCAENDEHFDWHNYSHVLLIYDSLLPRYKHIRLDGLQSTVSLVQEVLRYVAAQ